MKIITVPKRERSLQQAVIKDFNFFFSLKVAWKDIKEWL